MVDTVFMDPVEIPRWYASFIVTVACLLAMGSAAMLWDLLRVSMARSSAISAGGRCLVLLVSVLLLVALWGLSFNALILFGLAFWR